MFKLHYPVLKGQDFIIVEIAKSRDYNGWDSITF